MSNIPSELRYATSHEWVRNEGNGIVTAVSYTHLTLPTIYSV